MAILFRMGVPTLYHGSPFRLEHLEPRVPRAETPFQSQTAVFLTSNILESQLYALARDPERKNKGWSIQDGVLRLRKDLWLPPGAKYQLNDVGYLHVFKGFQKHQVQQNPDVPTEWASLVPVTPTRIEEVCICDIPSTAIQYVERVVGGKRTYRRKRKTPSRVKRTRNNVKN